MTPGCYGVALEEQVRGIIIQEVRAGSESLTSGDALVLQGLIPLGYWKVWPPSPGQHLCFPSSREPGNETTVFPLTGRDPAALLSSWLFVQLPGFSAFRRWPYPDSSPAALGLPPLP